MSESAGLTEKRRWCNQPEGGIERSCKQDASLSHKARLQLTGRPQNQDEIKDGQTS